MLVSVIIPTYNRMSTIRRTVDSVLAQTWKPMEVIVVDDGSTDQTLDVLSAYGDKIRVIRQSNQGPSAARNAGIRAATGEIISFLDSDDIWLPEKTERQAKLLQRTESLGVKCCICDARMEYATRTVSSFAVADLQPQLAEGVWTNPAEILVDRFLFFNQVAAIRREALEQAGPFREDLRIMEDYDLALRLSLLGPWAFVTEPLVVWHSDASDGLSRNISELDGTLKVYEILKNLGESTRFGPLLPKARFRRRQRVLQQRINALRYSKKSSPAAGMLGKMMLAFVHGRDSLYWKLPTTPKMAYRAA